MDIKITNEKTLYQISKMVETKPLGDIKRRYLKTGDIKQNEVFCMQIIPNIYIYGVVLEEEIVTKRDILFITGSSVVVFFDIFSE